MRISGIDKCECLNGEGWGVTLYVQGCSLHCEGCHNPETWSFKGGYDFTQEVQQDILELLNNPIIERLTISGGNPTELPNVKTLCGFLHQVKEQFPHMQIWLYTGHTFLQLTDNMIRWPTQSALELREVLMQSDVWVTGAYDKDKPTTKAFCGSENQEVKYLHKDIPKHIFTLIKNI